MRKQEIKSKKNIKLNKLIKYKLLIFGILIVTIVGFVSFGLYTMQIEDHYGNYQEIYYKSKDGDIIINEESSKIGIIRKNWKRLNVLVIENSSIDLYTFASEVGHYSKIKVFRPKTKIEKIEQMNLIAIRKLITENKAELIIEYKNEFSKKQSFI